MIEVGLSHRKKMTVLEKDTAIKVGSGTMEVLGTPILVAFMENTAYKSIDSLLKEGETSVGTSMDMDHLKGNLVGDEIECISSVVEVDGRKVVFNLEVFHDDKLVGRGTHTRFIVNRDKFLKKLIDSKNAKEA